MKKDRSRFGEVRPAAVLLIFLCPLIGFWGCSSCSDDAQVQIAADAGTFKAFAAPPRDIAYGPYSLKVTTNAAIIAWEEKIWGDTLRHVEVSVSGLSPATKYFYRVNGNGAEKDGRLVTAPAAPAPFSFFVWGDSRTGNDVARQIGEKMLTTDPDASFALHCGDMVMDGDDQQSWERDWWGPLSDFMLYLPIYPAMGNHEQNSAFYYRYFSSLTGGSCFYSFTWGAAHFVVLCLDEGNSISSEQIEWLKNDLEENRDATFKVVYHHVPPYFSSPADAAGSEQLRTVLVPLYEENGVDLVFSGDVHSYQHHLKNNIHYLISAGGGERPSECGLPLEGMTLSLFKTYHFIHAMVDGTSIHLTAYDLDGTVLDRLTLESGQISEVSSSIAVSVSSQEVVPGGECQVDLFIQNVQNLDSVSCTLEYKKDEPPAALQAVDADPNTAGIQVIKGDLGGEVIVNESDNGLEVLHYQEQHIGGRSAAKIKVATIKFNVPEDTQPTAFYLVPRCILRDAAGAEIVHFMGGVKMVVKKSEP